MEALFFKDNVYVSVNNESPIDTKTMESDSSFIGYMRDPTLYLYGSRVLITPDYSSSRDCFFYVDGIEIHKMDEDLTFSSSLSSDTVIAFLNQIENLGVDSFIENYKLSLEAFKEELRQLKTEYTQDNSLPMDENRIKFLTKIERMQSSIICILFSLSLHRNVGLDNHVYTDTYKSIINQFFNE